MKKILVTGGGGYVGTLLIDELLNNGHQITVLDTFWFGNFLQKNKNLEIIKEDIRNLSIEKIKGHQTIIHLANIANDPTVAMDPELSWNVNVLGTHSLIDKASRAGVEHFIFGSSGSVYGVKEEPNVVEDMVLVPISTYNKTKMIAERVIMSYSESLKVHCIRPATVCGYSPRMRLDISVNLLTMQALKYGEITVFGGSQTRPNINIKDMINVYLHFINNSNIENGYYNAGLENMTILKIAEIIKEKTGATIKIEPSNDPRSYRQNSDKLISTGFKFQYNVVNAIEEIIAKYNNKILEDKEIYYNLKVMKNLKLDKIKN
jgi:nucleoside-diphosphate-sugar epimerase|tara:strand:- start:6458 stop:7414 length:957 start_codon:yes stop_codon:yes gene_type:complete